MSLNRFTAWQDKSQKLAKVKEWLAHIGKTGRSTRDHTYILRLSSAHCAAPKFSIAGQYHEGGQNYWDSPKEFNEAMLEVVLSHFKEMADEAVRMLERRAAQALVEAEGEISAVQAAIDDAKKAA